MQFLTQQVLGDRSLCLNNHQRMLVTLITTLWITRLMETPLPLRGQLAHPPQCDLCCVLTLVLSTPYTQPQESPNPRDYFPLNTEIELVTKVFQLILNALGGDSQQAGHREECRARKRPAG